MMYLGDKAIGINNDGKNLRLMSTVTIQESLENDTTGNALAIYNNYNKDIANNVTVSEIVVVVAENNSARNYSLQEMILTPIDIYGSIVLRKGSNGVFSTRAVDASTSSWCSAGTILYIYFLKVGDTKWLIRNK